MIHARLNPGAVAHWRGGYALVIEAASVVATVAPIVTQRRLRSERVAADLGLACDALDRGDVLIGREDIGLQSSGEDLIVRVGACCPAPTVELVPFWMLDEPLWMAVLRCLRRVRESEAAERSPRMGVTLRSYQPTRGCRQIGRRVV